MALATLNRYDVPMIALADSTWAVIGVAGALYVVMSVRIARNMGRIGYNPIAWFFINVVATAIPAMIVLLHHRSRQCGLRSSDGPGRCRHCNALLPATLDRTEPSGIAECPSCGMKLDEEYLA